MRRRDRLGEDLLLLHPDVAERAQNGVLHGPVRRDDEVPVLVPYGPRLAPDDDVVDAVAEAGETLDPRRIPGNEVEEVLIQLRCYGLYLRVRGRVPRLVVGQPLLGEHIGLEPHVPCGRRHLPVDDDRLPGVEPVAGAVSRAGLAPRVHRRRVDELVLPGLDDRGHVGGSGIVGVAGPHDRERVPVAVLLRVQPRVTTADLEVALVLEDVDQPVGSSRGGLRLGLRAGRPMRAVCSADATLGRRCEANRPQDDRQERCNRNSESSLHESQRHARMPPAHPDLPRVSRPCQLRTPTPPPSGHPPSPKRSGSGRRIHLSTAAVCAEMRSVSQITRAVVMSTRNTGTSASGATAESTA